MQSPSFGADYTHAAHQNTMSQTAPSPSLARTPPAENKDILQLLTEQHELIRRFTALAVQLGHASGASPPELSETASRVLRYFALEYSRHVEAEDYILLPHLFTLPLSQELIEPLWELACQHEEFEQLLEQMLPLGSAVRDTPERYPELIERLAWGGRRLMTLMEEHVRMEERYLFPIIRSRFPRATLVELALQTRLNPQMPCG